MSAMSYRCGNHSLEAGLLLKKSRNTHSLSQIPWAVRNLQPFARAIRWGQGPRAAAGGRVSQTYTTTPGIPAVMVSSIFNSVGGAALACSAGKGLRCAEGPYRPWLSSARLLHYRYGLLLSIHNFCGFTKSGKRLPSADNGEKQTPPKAHSDLKRTRVIQYLARPVFLLYTNWKKSLRWCSLLS